MVHHSLGDGAFDWFRRMSEPVVCASAVMTPQNVVWEMERLIFETLYHLQPVYRAFPADLALQPAQGPLQAIAGPGSDPAALGRAVEAILDTRRARERRVSFRAFWWRGPGWNRSCR